jgi:hypothetical protein
MLILILRISIKNKILGFTSTYVYGFPLVAVDVAVSLLVGEALFGEHFGENGAEAGNILNAVAVGLGKSLGECPAHLDIGPCVNSHVEALEIGGRLGFVMYEHMNALVSREREHLIQTSRIQPNNIFLEITTSYKKLIKSSESSIFDFEGG